MFDSIPDNLPVVDAGQEDKNNKTEPVEVKNDVTDFSNGSQKSNDVKIKSDIFDYVPLDEETKSRINWKKWIVAIMSICFTGALGYTIWLGKIPFTSVIFFDPPWQLSEQKVSQYIINDLLSAQHVQVSAILTADRYKIILDDEIPQVNDIKADIKADINFNAPYDSKISFNMDHDGQEKTNLNYQMIAGQAYMNGQSTFSFFKKMFEISSGAEIILPQQTSQPSLTFAEIKEAYRQHRFLVASRLEKSTIDGQEYALVTLTTDLDIYQAFVQSIRDKKGVGLPYSANLDMIFSPQTTIKAAVRLSDKSFRNAYVEGVHSRLGKYNLSLTIDSLNNDLLNLTRPENVITTKASLEEPQPVEIPGDVIPEELKNLIGQQSEIIKKLIGSNPQLPSDFSSSYYVDSDDDGILDVIEVLIGTLPNKSDSDDDGYGDLQEIEAGYNPLGEGKLQFPSTQIIEEIQN